MIFRIRRGSDRHSQIRRLTHVYTKFKVIQVFTIQMDSRSYQPIVADMLIVCTELHQLFVFFPEPFAHVVMSVLIQVEISVQGITPFPVIKFIIERQLQNSGRNNLIRQGSPTFFAIIYGSYGITIFSGNIR